jgi:DNA-binding response OmpR family regulator
MKILDYHPRSTASLTRLQTLLQDYLRAHSGETITREQLSADVWQMNYFQASRTIDQTLSVVRKNLRVNERIVTVFGVGYRHEFLSSDAAAFPSNARDRREPSACVHRAA